MALFQEDFNELLKKHRIMAAVPVFLFAQQPELDLHFQLDCEVVYNGVLKKHFPATIANLQKIVKGIAPTFQKWFREFLNEVEKLGEQEP
jgi:hypothetical protein